MDFELSEELKMVQGLARDFVDERLRPLERDILGRAADLSDARAYLPEEKEAELAGLVREMGLWGLGVPEPLGGAGLDTLAVCLVEEELARTVVPFRFGDVTPILFECNKAQLKKYFTPALEGRKRAYLALMEPDGSADLTGLKMTAEKEDRHYILNGKKLSLSRAGSDFFAIVFAVTGSGPTCFLVDKGTPGFNVDSAAEATGWRALIGQTFSLAFDNCRVSGENLLGEEGSAFSLGRQWLPRRRVVRGARCVGMAGRLLEEATTQAASLETFGRPVHERSDIRDALAEIAVNIRAARLIVHEAAWKADNCRLSVHDTAVMKLYTTRMLQAVADRVAHVFNGPPYIEGQPMERLCRRILAGNVAGFTLEQQRHIIARDILQGIKV
jgi:acyl-CoA dehydrogenase